MRLLSLFDDRSQLAAMMAVGMVVAVVLDLLVIGTYGFSAEVDALILGLTIPLLLDTVFRESLRNVLVPHFTEYLAEYGTESTRFYVGRFMLSSALLGFAVGLIIFLPTLTFYLRFLDEDSRYALVLPMLWLLLPIPTFAFPATIASVFLNSQSKYWLFGVRQIVVFGVPLIALGASVYLDNGVILVALGYLLGFATFAALGLRASRAHIARNRQLLLSWKEHVIAFRIGRLMALGFGIRQFARFAERGASFFLGEGMLAAFYLASRVFSALQSVAGMAVSTAVLTRLSDHWLNREVSAIRNVLKSDGARTLITATAFAALASAGFAMAVEIQSAWALERSTKLALARDLFWIMAFALPAAALVPIFSSALHAANEQRPVFMNMMSVGLLRVVLVLAFAYSFGVKGIAVAATISILGSAINLYKRVSRTFSSGYQGAVDN